MYSQCTQCTHRERNVPPEVQCQRFLFQINSKHSVTRTQHLKIQISLPLGKFSFLLWQKKTHWMRFAYFLLHLFDVNETRLLPHWRIMTTTHPICAEFANIGLYRTIELQGLWWCWRSDDSIEFPFSCIIIMFTLFINSILWNASMQQLSSSVRACHQHHLHYQHCRWGTFKPFAPYYNFYITMRSALTVCKLHSNIQNTNLFWHVKGKKI